ncbi:hypothetical protein T440DRAFT_487258 [Plenodomus tracheiphilus IPT5]|uniref:PCI domain-containing protein n=1 Tax=Plenodomus tracheiphilus IPT5 TaxID=1408161 RepID=A0A6A7BF57_9PLEO|nr:hypothetical protein T440DRAFT_487258 [Plenodomus tracheiphilus IPT5]
MSITDLEQRCNELRQDLKTANAHISLAQKYKEYNKLRGRLAGKPDPSTPSKRAPRPKSCHDVERTPKAPPKPPTFTPTKRKRVEEEDIPENVDPAIEYAMSPEGPNFIGPTPQRNGIVLGLFDLLPEGTPSKKRAVLGEAQPNIPQTPSKDSDTSIEPRARGERTPLSAGKRFLLNQFVTPKKRKLDDQGTPSTVRGLATPAFLRRDNVLSAIEEDDEPIPRPMPWKRRGMGRSLSSMIQAMKKDEEDRLDDEADIMREMEMEEQGISKPIKPKVPQIQVEDSQFDMPLGPDRGVESDEDSDAEPELGRDGKPRKAWKKKGLKRQTRRVIRQAESEDDKAAVPETQAQADGAADDIDSDDDGSVYASDASHTPKKHKMQPKKAEESTEKPKEGIVKKAARKIKATANANYRRLNIKGKAAASGTKVSSRVTPLVGGKHGAQSGQEGSSVDRYRTLHYPHDYSTETFEGYEIPWRAAFSPPLAPAAPPTPSAFRSRKAPPKLPLAATNTTTASTSPTPPTHSPRPAPSSPSTTTSQPPTMAEKELQTALQQLRQTLQSHNYQQSTTLLSKAKIALLNLNALIPQEKAPRKHLQAARETLELGAIISIRLKDTVSFTRYFQQLQPFYSLPESTLPRDGSNASKVTGLYLLLLLSEGDYAGFHTLLETLEVAAAQGGKLEDDAFIQYPIRLEQALMEGSYDRVWGETKKERVPSEEFGLFTEILIGTIRKEIASCSERAYPSIPISDAKSLLFLDSEGSVVNFAKEFGWVVRDGRIYFPQQEEDYLSKDILVTSDQVIENTLGYARELETIV